MHIPHALPLLRSWRCHSRGDVAVLHRVRSQEQHPLRVRCNYLGNEERQAINDISAVGFPGIQFRANAVKDFKPAELKDLLAQHKLTFVALSSGDVSLDQPEAEQRSRKTSPTRST
jgi:hypothetical protein